MCKCGIWDLKLLICVDDDDDDDDDIFFILRIDVQCFSLSLSPLLSCSKYLFVCLLHV